ncbi:helix-turn-helix transcriptional regulator [Saccharothrix texasensis]|uniref:helix-turn-helix transcriptional regulator n=1 Tax=Saccharothrix texasensis TaxID=103734 RepID=UPI0011CDDA2A|nr:helix-turn-helix transcriptional regulator [Saccharothrix texasensis]
MANNRAEPRRERPDADRAAQGVGDLRTPRDFLTLLDAMRKSRKLSYRQISQRAGKGMASSTAQAMVVGDTLPPLHKLELFLAGCNVPPEERRRWIHTWHRINQSTPEASGTAPDALPTPDTTPQTTGRDVLPARPSQPVTPPVPAPVPPLQRQRSRSAGMRRLRFTLLALTAFTTAVGVLTASAILMWLHHVPTEIMFAVYGLLTVSVTSWMMVAQRHPPARDPTRGD